MRTLLILFLFLSAFNANAQITAYYDSDVPDKYVAEVEDMTQYEIKVYNDWKKEGVNDTLALAWINAGRAQNNLISAPATLVDYSYELDSANQVSIMIQLINSTTRTIKEARFSFEFYNDDEEPVYDINTGNKYFTVVFKNLKGRTSSDKYQDIAKSILDSYSILTNEEASYHNTFTNKKAKKIRLAKVSFKYSNGTTSSRFALFSGNDLFEDGPLQPVAIFSKRFSKKEPTDNDNDEVSIAEKMPSFKGNVNAWLAQNLVYPDSAAKNGVQGKVVVRFVIEKDGSVSNAQVIRSVDPYLDQAALEAVRSMPKWNPGTTDGKPARVWFTLPVTFKLQ